MLGLYILISVVVGVLLGLGMHVWDRYWEKIKIDRIKAIDEEASSITVTKAGDIEIKAPTIIITKTE